jgi:EmrB/QacA subfamily drug resistance transporter
MYNGISPPGPWRKRVVLATCCSALFLAAMDVTIVNVALPAIRKDLSASVTGLQWAVDGYTVVVASLLMLSGSTADRLGRRRTFQVGLAVFTLGSLLCSLAGSTASLVGYRALQAVGGSMLNPVAMSIVVNTFTDPKERARAIGIWGAVFGAAMAAGPVLGGALVEAVGWRSIFWVNVPVGLLAIALTARFVPESYGERGRRVDIVGQLLVMVALIALTATVIEGRRAGFSSVTGLGGFALAFAGFVGLAAWESRHPEPLVDLRFFRSLPFATATLMAVLAFAGFGGFLFLNSLYLQEARGLAPSAAGLMTLPIALAVLVCSPLSGRLVAAGRTRLALVASGIAIAVGAALLTGLSRDTPTAHLTFAYVVFGAGLGTVNAPITNAAVSGMPRARAGLASAVASTSRQVGASLGVALAGALAGQGIEAAHRADYAASIRTVFGLIMVFGVAIAALGVLSTGARARASAARIAFLLDAPGEPRESRPLPVAE